MAIAINFEKHKGDGGYGFWYRWTWRVRTRIYINGHWTPFMRVKYHFR